VYELERLTDERRANLIAVGPSKHPRLTVGSIPRRLARKSHLSGRPLSETSGRIHSARDGGARLSADVHR
jgi:hypothetical protein